MADLRTFRDKVVSAFSRVFPTTRDISLQVDVSQQDNYLYVDVHVSHQDATYRLENLGKIPQRIKIGSRYLKISQKNRQTLKHLAEWDPAFDAKRGFTFYEKTSQKSCSICVQRVRLVLLTKHSGLRLTAGHSSTFMM